MTFQADYARALQTYEIVMPAIKKALQAEDILTLEGSQNRASILLDTCAGIDAIVKTEAGLRGLAMRISFDAGWDTFTIRAERQSGKKTELSKRLYQIENGYLHPELTAQVYFSDGSINSGAIVRTANLYKYALANHKKLTERLKPAPDGNLFTWIKFSEIEKKIKRL